MPTFVEPVVAIFNAVRFGAFDVAIGAFQCSFSEHGMIDCRGPRVRDVFIDDLFPH